MSSIAIAAGIMLMMIVGFRFVQVERLVKLSFGSWVLLGWSLAVGV